MLKFGKTAVPVLLIVALLVIGAPSSLWASVPEIDPSSGMSALALIAGVVALVRAKKFTRSDQ